MLYQVHEAEARPGYRLWIRFEDGTEGEVNLAHLVGSGVFERWQDEDEFMRVTIDPESGTVTWPGDIDIAPDALYRELTAVATS